jgi:hypothetical protein
MKRLMVGAAVLAALATAGIAVARGLDDNVQSVSAVAGTFTATTVSHASSHSCTTATGKTIASIKGTYTGTSSGSADLTGPATIQAHGTINVTDGIGVVSGTLSIGSGTHAQFTTVYDHGALAGTATGHAATPHTRLLGNLSATFSAAGGFTGGKVGGGTSGGSAVELAAGGCRPSQAQSEAKGPIDAVSTTSITVAGLTCAVPPSLAAKVGALTKGTLVEIKCAFANGTNTLVKIEVKK